MLRQRFMIGICAIQEKALASANIVALKEETSMRSKILLGHIHTNLMVQQFDLLEAFEESAGKDGECMGPGLCCL